MKIIGRDINGVPRVWGEGATRDDATHEAQIAATEYAKLRPDTGPLSQWRFDAESIATVSQTAPPAFPDNGSGR